MRTELRYFAVGLLLVSVLVYPQHNALAADPVDPRTDGERLHYFDLASALSADNAKRDDARDALADVLDRNSHAFLFYALPPGTVRDSYKRFLQAVGETRVDEQVGPGGGPTNVVSKTGMVSLFGFGLDSNDAIKTIDPNVLSLRLNVDGLARFLSNQDTRLICTADPACDTPGPLRNVEVWTAFNVSSSDSRALAGVSPSGDETISPDPVDFTTSVRGGFSHATVRFALDKRRDLRAPEYRERWIGWLEARNEMLQAGGKEFLNYLKLGIQQLQQVGANGKLIKDTGETDQYTLWLRETREKLKSAPANETEWRKVLAAQLDSLLDKLRKNDRDFDTRSLEFAKSYIRYLEARRDAALTTLVPENASVIEYTFSEPPLQPKVHSVTFAHSYNVGQNKPINPGTVTFNVGMDFYHDLQPSDGVAATSRWRGARLSIQFDRPLGAADSPAQLSVGGHYQYLANPVIIVPPGATFGSSSISVADQTPIVGEQGSLFAAHATLILRTARNGLKIPIGVSWSSRTDLQKGQEVRGHIGFTFDSTPLTLIPGGR